MASKKKISSRKTRRNLALSRADRKKQVPLDADHWSAPRNRFFKGRRWLALTVSLLLLAVAGVVIVTRVRKEPSPETEAKISPPAALGRIQFENRQPESGIEFVLDNDTTDDKLMIDAMLGGVSLLDYDNDGFLDIFFTNGARIPTLEKDAESFYCQLYRNGGDGTFTDVTAKAGVKGIGYNMGATVGDFDNDGYPDLYVTGVNVNTLYRNNADGTFSDVTEAADVAGRLASGRKAWSVGGGWMDYDNDGDLDLFVVNYVDWSLANNLRCGDPGRRLSCSPANHKGLPNILYRNEGDGTFTDVSASTGISDHIGKGMGVSLADYDNDGYMDILVGNDTERNFLFRNLRGQGFSEVGVEAGVAFNEDGFPLSSMGVDFRDVNNDGLPDVTVTALANETFPLFLNTPEGVFIDATYSSGLGTASYTMSGWGNGIFDFDNDGFKDIFTAGCHVSENVEHYRPHKYKLPNAVWQNQGDGGFKNASAEAGSAFRTPAAHRCSAFGDLDNDGRVDVVVSIIRDKVEVLYNTSTRDHNWITIETEGTKSNRDGIGTRIKLTGESGLVQYNHTNTSVGYASSSDKRVHFGLGSDSQIREIELRWPSGKRQILKDVAANQILKVREE